MGDRISPGDVATALEDWLKSVLGTGARSDDVVDWAFPTDDLRDQYLATVHLREEAEVRALLRKLLIPSGSLGADQRHCDLWSHPLGQTRSLRRNC
jgi:hypothetical protein